MAQPGKKVKEKRTYNNPVIDYSLPDPTIIKADDGYFYLYATEDIRNLPIHRSANLVEWEFVGTAFTDSTRPTFQQLIWAPDIRKIGDKYVLYYANSSWGEEHTNGIGVAWSLRPEGPFTDAGKLFLSDEIEVMNSIDAFYMEENGRKYLFWGSWHGLWGVELTDDGLALQPNTPKIPIAGNGYEAGLLHKHGDYYYLFASTGSCCEGLKSTYTTVVGRSKNLFGPYVNRKGELMLSNHHEVVIEKNKDFVGPGHNSQLVTDDAGNDWIFYHGVNVKNPEGRVLMMLSTPGRNNPENPLMELHEGNTKRQLHRILGRINIGYDLPWGIKYNANLGYVKVDHYSKDFKHAMYTYNPKTLERKNFSAYVSAKDWDNNAINYTFYNTLSWGKSFGGNHNFNVMVGTEYKRYDGKNFQAKKRDYFNNQLTALSVGSTMEDISGGSSLELLFSYFGRITYDYKEKYLIDVTARYDGSSKFAKGNRWAFFPAVSVGWRIDKENFMQNVRAVDVLKLRGSVGEMGNQAIGNYEYLMAVLANKSYNYSFGDVLSGGAAIKDFVDENISWETTRTYNLGLDFEAFDHRLLFSVDLYKKRTEGILRDVKIPAQIGNLNGPKQNIGVVANDGVELNLQWRSAVKNFHYSLGGNFCYNKNIVVDLDGQEYIKTFNIIREGEPIDAWYLYQADGFYNSYEEIANSVTVGSGVKPGYIRYKNLNNDDKIDNDDRAVCGNLTPSITYAFNFSLGWKGLELSAQFQGVADVKTYLSGNLAAPFWNGAGVLKEWATDAWTPENHNSRLPILHTATGAPEMHDYKNTQWLYDASYLRCKQLQLSYTLPKRWISKLGMSQCQIFVNGENLFTISPLKMFDPEIDLSSTNLMQYPSLRTINFGFNITF